MADPELISGGERDPRFLDHLNLCWNMDGGLFPTTLVFFRYLENPHLPLSSWQERTLLEINSNQITHPYVADWVAGYPTKQIDFNYLGPEWFCPPDICKRHLELITAAQKAYDRLWPSKFDDENYRPKFLEAISLKIAAMIAIVHQVMYEGKVTHQMVNSTYRPCSKWSLGQERITTPDLASGLMGAFAVLARTEARNDARIAYLFQLPFSFKDKKFIFSRHVAASQSEM